MENANSLIQFLAAFSGSLATLLSITLFLRLHWPAPALWFLKLYVSALSPLFLLIGWASIITGLATGSVLIAAIGIFDVLVFAIHIARVTHAPFSSSGFESECDLQGSRSNPLPKKYFLSKRTLFKLPVVPDPRMEPNIPFASIPGSGRNLLCDVWLPPASVASSGLALIYLHGSAWYLLDKDAGTRPLFKHLAAQGHVIMDVAYRLAPETDMMGMIQDAKRAIAWMKENAVTYKVNPNLVVVSGGSAGAHLALMAAYTSNNPHFTPRELEDSDLGVCSVISLYGPTDLKALYYHTNQQITTRATPGRTKKTVPAQMPGWIIRKMGDNYHRLGFDKGFENSGALAPLMGGHPDECPETYAHFSPFAHVHSNCPPSLLIHGEHDLIVPVQTVRHLYTRLTEEKVPAAMFIIPQSDHGFDLVLPQISPSAHTAFYEVERFLALQLKTIEVPQTETELDQAYPLQQQII